MDVLGVKRIIAIIEKNADVVIPKTGEVLAKVSNELDGLGVFVGRATDIADSVIETELIKDLDAAIESVPAEFKALAQALRGAIDHGVRVGTRVSLAAQELTGLVAAVREYGFETHSRIAKPQ